MKEESLLLLSNLQKLINQVVLIDYTIIILGGGTLAVMTKEEFAQAVGNTTAGDMAMTLVSVDPESLRLVPVAGGENVICSADTIYPWKMVAAGVSDGSDFILWGYSGVDTYRLEDAEFTRAQEVWEMPCGTEGTCAVIVPDGRILYIGATGGVQGQTAAGVDISGKDPAKTYFYYEPLK